MKNETDSVQAAIDDLAVRVKQRIAEVPGALVVDVPRIDNLPAAAVSRPPCKEKTLWSIDSIAAMTDTELESAAMAENPGMFAIAAEGLSFSLQRTRCINLWRNEECYTAGDPPVYVLEGYPRFSPQAKKENPSE